MALQAVFIDVGNTLLYEKPSRYEIYARAARERGLQADEASMRALMGSAHDELPLEVEGHYRYSDEWFRRFVARIFGEQLGLGPEHLDELLDELFLTFSDPATFRLHDGANELLADLRRRGLRLAIVSNWSSRLPQLLDGLGVTDRVDAVVCSALERVEKPDPEIFRRALKRCGVAPEGTLHAGDQVPNDVIGARAAGIRPILVDHDGRCAAAARSADVPLVSDLRELHAHVLEHLS